VLVALAACGPTTLRSAPTRRIQPAPLPVVTPYIEHVTPICKLPDGRGRYEAHARYAGTYSYVIVVPNVGEFVAEGNPPVPAGVTLRIETGNVPFYLVYRHQVRWVRASPNVVVRPLVAC
jgi:hypothetical protein